MSLDAALAIASSGLANVNRQLGVVSQNVANAETAGYTRQVARQTALVSEGVGLGVRTEAATRSVDAQMQAEARRQGATVAALRVSASALEAIDAAHGTPGQGDDLASLVGDLRDVFTGLSADPADATGQMEAVSAARALASGINRVAAACAGQRQAAQDSLVADMATLNAALGEIGDLSARISLARAQGQSSATLEDQRDAAMRTVSDLVGAQFVEQPGGEMLAFTPSGLVLPTRGVPAFAVDAATLGPAVAGPAVTLGGTDVTAQLREGRIGANLALRDVALPTVQAELDEFAHDLAGRFDAVGLELFTDGPNPVAAAAAGPPVQAPYVGLAGRIQVNPAVAASPSLVRDGTDGTASGQAGYADIVDAVLDKALGTGTIAGHPAPAVSGLGAAGNLAARFPAPRSVADFATTLVGAQATASAGATAALESAEAAQAVLDEKVADVSGVSVDTEMSTMIGLQNAYAANARVIATIQDLWSQLLAMVGG